MSERGESRSCGSVSQEGYSTTPSGGSRVRRAAARSSASRPVAVTASTVRPVSRARAATVKGRAAGGPTRSAVRRCPSPAAFSAWVSAGSSVTASSSPCRLMKGSPSSFVLVVVVVHRVPGAARAPGRPGGAESSRRRGTRECPTRPTGRGSPAYDVRPVDASGTVRRVPLALGRRGACRTDGRRPGFTRNRARLAHSSHTIRTGPIPAWRANAYSVPKKPRPSRHVPGQSPDSAVGP